MNELAQTLIQQIRDTHREVVAAGAELREALIKKVNAARATGFYLRELREHMKRQRAFFGDDRTKAVQWTEMFRVGDGEEEFVFDFSVQTARTYIRLADAMPDPVKELPEALRCLKDVLIATGALSAQGHGSQSRREGNFFSLLVQHAGRFDSLWAKHDGERFVREMTPDAREQVVTQLMPLKARIDAILEAATDHG